MKKIGHGLRNSRSIHYYIIEAPLTVNIHFDFCELSYSDVSIKNIDILSNRQYIANTADLAQEQYS